MITNFEEITKSLTYDEKKLVRLVLKGFNKHIGKSQIINSKTIVRRMREKGYDITGPRLRKIVNFIRQKSLAPICSNSKGYWWATSRKEVEIEIQSLVDRQKAITAAADGLRAFV